MQYLQRSGMSIDFCPQIPMPASELRLKFVALTTTNVSHNGSFTDITDRTVGIYPVTHNAYKTIPQFYDLRGDLQTNT